MINFKDFPLRHPIKSSILISTLLALQACATPMTGRHLITPSPQTAAIAQAIIRGNGEASNIHVIYTHFNSMDDFQAATCAKQQEHPAGSTYYGAIICQDDQPLAFASYLRPATGLSHVDMSSEEQRRLARIATNELIPKKPLIVEWPY